MPVEDPTDFSKLRVEYRRQSLSESDVDSDPIRQFTAWLQQAIDSGLHEPNAMTLATCGQDNAPSARMVLLKQVDHRGFAFYTNYLSRKAAELKHNPRAALVFYWAELERQVRIEGTVARTSAEESDEYFAQRPFESRIGAAASPQSQVVPSRAFLEKRFAQLTQQHASGQIPRPAHWGGYRLRPGRIEFWQGRPNRLHDRIEYLPDDGGTWLIRRLAP